MNRAQYRSITFHPFTIMKRRRQLLTAVLASLLIALILLVSAVAAQKSVVPQGGDPVQERGHLLRTKSPRPTNRSEHKAAAAGTGIITGTISADVGGTLLTGIEVCAYYDAGSSWNWSGCANTDANGDYDIGGLAAGTYRVEFYDYNGSYLSEYYDNALDFDSAAGVAVTTGVTTPGINAALADPGHISGLVTAEIGGALLSDIEACALILSGSVWDNVFCDVTGVDGSYDIGGLAAGSYRVQFYDWYGNYLGEYYDNAADLNSAAGVTVTAGSTTSGINAALAEPGHIMGTVTAESGGAPLDEIEVCAYRSSNSSWNQQNCAYTDPNGSYVIGSLPAGTYRVAFYDWYSEYLGEYYDNAANLNSASDISVTVGGTTSGIDAALALAAVTQDLTLDAGWNLVSIYVEAPDTAVASIMADVVDDVVLMKNGAGQVYWPAFGIDEIGDWDVWDGYQIYMDNSAVLSVTGLKVDPALLPIDLPAGWSLVAYLRDNPLPVDQALGSLGSELIIAKNSYGEVYWPEYGVNQIGDMQSGEGNQLYLNAPAPLLYPAN